VSSNASFTIVDTDYKNWAVMHSCGDFFGFSSLQFAWIYSRTRELSQTHQDAAIEAFKKQNIDITALVMSDQTDCTVEKPLKKQ
jgi:lipocalin